MNWIHLDFKGVMPGAARLVAWIDWLADHGFDGVVLEYEDRIPWKTWPGTFRPGLALADWQRVIAAARGRGMEVVPLIQTHGHLEWLLKHPRWAAWRENGCWNEICPQIDDIMPAIDAWLDEVIAIHGQLQYLHIGGDETWNLASCPRCRAIAEASPDGKLEVYLTHLQRVVDKVVARGIRPLIWADAFWREARLDLVKRLPPGVMLCDWQYTGPGPWETATQLGQAGHMVVGCSSVRPSYDLAECVGPQGPRVENVRAWRGHAGTSGTIHTVWGRTRSLLLTYGPWEGWLPGLLAAGEPDRWSGHALEPWAAKLDAAIAGPVADARQLADDLERERFADEWTDACRRWWVMALRWRVILQTATGNARTFAALEAVHGSIGVDPDFINHRRAAHGRLLDQTSEWEAQARAFFAERELTDGDEFIASRTNLVRTLMTRDWAAPAIPVAQPRTAR